MTATLPPGSGKTSKLAQRILAKLNKEAGNKNQGNCYTFVDYMKAYLEDKEGEEYAKEVLAEELAANA